jgi:hypothetical protein
MNNNLNIKRGAGVKPAPSDDIFKYRTIYVSAD